MVAEENKNYLMKVHGISLGIDVTHGDHLIAASAARFGNVH